MSTARDDGQQSPETVAAIEEMLRLTYKALTDAAEIEALATEPTPTVHYCGATINGPKMGRRVVLWRKKCRIRVKNDGDRCRFHGGAREGSNQ